MSNQRPGKVVRAADPTMKDMNTLKFFKNAQKVLEQSDDTIMMHRQQGAITALRKLKYLRDEVNGS